MSKLDYGTIGQLLEPSAEALAGGPALYEISRLLETLPEIPRKPLQLLPHLAVDARTIGHMAEVYGKGLQCMDEGVIHPGPHEHCAGKDVLEGALLNAFPQFQTEISTRTDRATRHNEFVPLFRRPDFHKTNGVLRNWADSSFDLPEQEVKRLCMSGEYAPLIVSMPLGRISRFLLRHEGLMNDRQRNAMIGAITGFNMGMTNAVAFGHHNLLEPGEPFHVVDINMPTSLNKYESALVDSANKILGNALARHPHEYHSIIQRI